MHILFLMFCSWREKERRNMERKWRRQDKVTTCLLCQTDLIQTVTSKHLTLDLVWSARCASLAHFSPPTLAALMSGNFSDTWPRHYSDLLRREISVRLYQVFWQTLLYASNLLIENKEVDFEAEMIFLFFLWRSDLVMTFFINILTPWCVLCELSTQSWGWMRERKLHKIWVLGSAHNLKHTVWYMHVSPSPFL